MSEQEDFGDCCWQFPTDRAALDKLWDSIPSAPIVWVDTVIPVEAISSQEFAAHLERRRAAPAFITGDWSVEYPPIAEQSSEGYGEIVTRDVFPPNAMRAWSV